MKQDIHDLQVTLDDEIEDSNMNTDGFLESDSEKFDKTHEHWSDCYVYAATAGIIGAFAVLFAGTVSKVLLNDAEEGFQSTVFYASLGGMAACLLWQVQLLNRGLESGDVMVVLPVFQSFWITFGAISGVTFYGRGVVSTVGLFFVFLG